MRDERSPVAVVFAGGVGLGSYQGGVYAALHEHKHLRPKWLAGSSVGAVNCALIAGTPSDERIEVLRRFWRASDLAATRGSAFDRGPWASLQHLHSWFSALQTRMFGSPGNFTPRVVPHSYERFSSLYDLAPLRQQLLELIDFERLNSGEVRVAVATTDIASGELVVFDTAKGDRIEVDHLLATCGFLPEFAPVEIDGRLLGDGGLSANAPIEAVLHDLPDSDLLCFVVDVYARDAGRPRSLEDALARKNDLIFGNQTVQRLEAYRREGELRAQIALLADELPAQARNDSKTSKLLAGGRKHADRILYLSYRAPRDEAGPEKPFDYSRRSLANRWQSGALDVEEALRALDAAKSKAPGFEILAIRRDSDLPETEQLRRSA